MRASGFATGTTVLALPHDAILELPFLVSEKKILDKFNAIIKSIMEKLENNQVQIHNLSNTRNSLLPKLMSGKIRVRVSA